MAEAEFVYSLDVVIVLECVQKHGNYEHQPECAATKRDYVP